MLSTDFSPQIVKAVNEFVRHVGAENDGWQKRYAQKFGLIYAAMKLGVNLGLLPWSEELPLKVATKCYRKARKGAMSEAEVNRYFAEQFCKTMKGSNRVADVPKGATPRNPLKLPRRCVALRYYKGSRLKVGVFDDALVKRLKTKKAKSLFTAALFKARVIGKGHGHAGTVHVHLPVMRDGEPTLKSHVWEMDWERLRKFVR